MLRNHGNSSGRCDPQGTTARASAPCFSEPNEAVTKSRKNTWVFGYGSLIWGTGGVKIIECREGILTGWHREWTWISKSRHGAPTCSLRRGGQVKGVFLRLNGQTTDEDLEEFRKRENRETEEISVETPEVGAITHFWTMGSNLEKYPELNGLTEKELPKALAERAKSITSAGPDGVVAADYIWWVHMFDRGDALTAAIANYL
jgi:hypothetical protein